MIAPVSAIAFAVAVVAMSTNLLYTNWFRVTVTLTGITLCSTRAQGTCKTSIPDPDTECYKYNLNREWAAQDNQL